MPILAQWIPQHLDMLHIAQWTHLRKTENLPFQIIFSSGPFIRTQSSITFSSYIFQEKEDWLFTNRSVWVSGVEVKFISMINSIPSRISLL